MRIDYRVVFPTVAYALDDIELRARTSGLERTTLELVGVRVSQLNGCRHSADMHGDNAVAFGMSAELVARVSAWHNTSDFSEGDRAALRWAELLTRLPMTDDPAVALGQLSAQFDEREVVALTGMVIAVNGRNRLHLGLGEPDGEAQRQARSVAAQDPVVQRLAAELERVEAEVARVREDYQRAVRGPPGPRWYQSGSIHPELDDPAIAPG